MLRYILGKYKNIKRFLGKHVTGYLNFLICEIYMKCTIYKYAVLTSWSIVNTPRPIVVCGAPAK